MTTRKLGLGIIAAAAANDDDDDDDDDDNNNNNNNNSESLENITFWVVIYTSNCEAYKLEIMEYTADHNCLCGCLIYFLRETDTIS
jgi:hypothetical protein